MGYARKHHPAKLAKYETLYEDPDYHRTLDRLRAFGIRDKVTTGIFTGGSTLETLGGLVAVVVAVVGLSCLPIQLAAVATIAIGVGLAAEGASIMARWREALRKLDGSRFDRNELVGGVSTEVFGGVVGIVLGVLALTGTQPLILLPVAAIVFGGSLLLGGAAQPELVFLQPERNPRYARATYSAIHASGGVMVLVGVASAVLGILGLLNVGPILTLTLVAMLAIGGALLFAGGALTARFIRRFV